MMIYNPKWREMSFHSCEGYEVPGIHFSAPKLSDPLENHNIRSSGNSKAVLGYFGEN
jgi:hypothetical protein